MRGREKVANGPAIWTSGTNSAEHSPCVLGAERRDQPSFKPDCLKLSEFIHKPRYQRAAPESIIS